MTTRLRELLDPKPNGRELRLGEEFASGPAWTDSNRDIVKRGYASELAGSRRALARETVKECAKAMCSFCYEGHPLQIEPHAPNIKAHHNGIVCGATAIWLILHEESEASQ